MFDFIYFKKFKISYNTVPEVWQIKIGERFKNSFFHRTFMNKFRYGFWAKFSFFPFLCLDSQVSLTWPVGRLPCPYLYNRKKYSCHPLQQPSIPNCAALGANVQLKVKNFFYKSPKSFFGQKVKALQIVFNSLGSTTLFLGKSNLVRCSLKNEM
jgi:hypothetical protein